MSIKEQNVVITSKDELNNTVIYKPYTDVSMVEGAVSSINNIVPDSNGNVTIDVPNTDSFAKKEDVYLYVGNDTPTKLTENLIVLKTKADHTAFHHGCEAIVDGDIYWCPDKNKDKYRRKDVNKDSNIKNTINICPICKKNIIHKRSNMCPSCSHLIRRKIDRPSKEELFELIKTKPFIQIGKMFGVSDNAIRKWCKYYNLPYKKEDINNFELN